MWFLAGCFSRRLLRRVNRCDVAYCLACSAIGAVVDFDNERTIVFLFDSLNWARLKAVIVFVAYFLVDDIRHTASVGSGTLSPAVTFTGYRHGAERYVTFITQGCAAAHYRLLARAFNLCQVSG
jgi:hypothetical protein